MYIIAVYDIFFKKDEKKAQKRVVKVMKTFRKYLHHTQKSVFEGEISDAKFFKLKKEIEFLINSEDSIIFYKINSSKELEKIKMGSDFESTSNIL